MRTDAKTGTGVVTGVTSGKSLHIQSGEWSGYVNLPVDAPQVGDFHGGGECGWLDSLQHLADLVPIGSTVTLSGGHVNLWGDSDLAVWDVDVTNQSDVDLALAQVEAGFAASGQASYDEAENQAMLAGAGLWALCAKTSSR